MSRTSHRSSRSSEQNLINKMKTFPVVLVVLALVAVSLAQRDPLIAGQRNQICKGRNNEEGTCQSRASCRRNNGVASGQCGIASGICCTQILATNEATTLKRVTMTRPADNSILDFNYRFTPANERVCQMRVDFRVLDLAQPTVTPAAAGSTASTSECTSEYLIVAGIKLCGTSRNQHVYVPLDSKRATMATIQIHLTSSTTTANWNIFATQLECAPGHGSRLSRSSNVQRNGRAEEDDEVEVDAVRTRSTVVKDAPWVAPSGCLQYYPNSTGTVSSFNFDTAMESQRQYLPNLNYAICFNRLNAEKLNFNFTFFQMSDLSQSTSSDTAFDSEDDDATTEAPAATKTADTVDSKCAATGAQTTDTVQQDYLMIPQAIYAPNTSANFFCGKVLNNVTISNYNEMGPFVLRFFSDNLIDTTANNEKGFQFTYRLTA